MSPVAIVTSVESIDAVFGDSGLLQNAPNPFSSGTEIQFYISRPGQTVLKVYDLVGKEVATLVNEDLQAGAYRVAFEPYHLPPGTIFTAFSPTVCKQPGRWFLNDSPVETGPFLRGIS